MIECKYSPSGKCTDSFGDCIECDYHRDYLIDAGIMEELDDDTKEDNSQKGVRDDR